MATVLRFPSEPQADVERRVDLLRKSLDNIAKMRANGVSDEITLPMCEVIQRRLDALEE